MCFDKAVAPPPPPPAPAVPNQPSTTNIINEVPQELKDYYKFLQQIGADQYDTAKKKYGPLEDKLIKESERFSTQGYADEQAAMAESDVNRAFGEARAANDTRLAAFGIDPSQGSARSLRLGADLAQAGTLAAASTGARRGAQLTGYNALAGVAGRGDAKVQSAIQATGMGGNMAQSAYGQQQQNAQYQQGLGFQSNAMGYQGGLQHNQNIINAQNQANSSNNAAIGGIVSLAGTAAMLF